MAGRKVEEAETSKNERKKERTNQLVSEGPQTEDEEEEEERWINTTRNNKSNNNNNNNNIYTDVPLC